MPTWNTGTLFEARPDPNNDFWSPPGAHAVVRAVVRDSGLHLPWGWALKSALLIVPLALLTTYELFRLITGPSHPLGVAYEPLVCLATIGPVAVYAVVMVKKYRRLTWRSVASSWAVAFGGFMAYGLLSGVM